MRRRCSEKKNEKGYDPDGASGAEIAEDCSHGVDDYLYLVLFISAHFNQETMERAS
jgi:hypothetical protein